MKTLYIDIYFMINFTVDFLALHFASIFSKTPSNALRLILGAAVGAAASCILVFLPENALIYFLSALLIMVTIVIVSIQRVSLFRRIKFSFAFLFFLALIGGLTYSCFILLEKYVPDYNAEGPQSRRLLCLAMIILMSIGVIRLFLSLFNANFTEKAVRIKIEFLSSRLEFDALVDSGNLLRDPIDFTPVLLLKKSIANGIFPNGIPRIQDGAVPQRMKKYIRLIPFEKNGEKRVYTGIRPDIARVMRKGKWESIRIIIIIDDEEGSFGGYEALMPATALESI